MQAYSVSSTSFQQSDFAPLGSALCKYKEGHLYKSHQAQSEWVKLVCFGNYIMTKPALVLTELLHWARLHQHPVDRDRLLLPGIGCSTMWKLIYVWHILYFILRNAHCNALKVPARETKARKLICFAEPIFINVKPGGSRRHLECSR